jgi:DNA-binding protein HU-beta
MNKTDLVNSVAEQAELTKKDAAQAVDAIFDAILNSLKAGDSVQILGFGNFEVRDRAARTGRNPQTGEEIEIPASKVPAFKPGKQLKEAVKEADSGVAYPAVPSYLGSMEVLWTAITPSCWWPLFSS